MATCNWLSRAEARAQVSTATPANVEIGDVFTLTINGKSISYTATAATVADVTAGLVAAWNASAVAEFAEITASDETTHVELTGDTAGLPFTVTAAATDGGGTDDQTLTMATTTDATGPNHWNDANNWDGGSVPATGDDANVDLSRGSILYGMNQSSVTLASLDVFSSVLNSGNTIGLPKRNISGSYTEYRQDYLQISATTCRIDVDSTRVKIDFGSNQNATDIYRTGQQAEQGIPAVLIKGSHASNAWEVVTAVGSVGFAFFDDETCQASTLKVNAQASVVVGAGATIATVTSSGNLDYRGTYTTLNCYGNTAVIRGSTNATNLTAEGGTVDYRSSGTVTNVTAGGRREGRIDCSNDLSGRTFTNTTLKRGGSINDPNATITYTNKIALDSSVSQVTAA